jgi:hypothetical protein
MTSLLMHLGLTNPVMAAPMAGGATTPARFSTNSHVWLVVDGWEVRAGRLPVHPTAQASQR